MLLADLHILKLLIMLATHLRDHHLVVGLAAVLKQDRVDHPNRGEEGILVLSVVQGLVEHLVKANRVYKETAVDAINSIII